MDDIFTDIQKEIEGLGGSWTAYLIRALWPHEMGAGRQEVITEVLVDALLRGRNTPSSISDVLQSTLQKHNGASAVFRGSVTDDIFEFVGGKGSGVWGVRRDVALAWMAANGRTCDFTLATG